MIDKKEVLRYAGVKEPTKEILTLLDECIKEAESFIKPRLCYRQFEVTLSDFVEFPFAKVKSEKLLRNLSGCKEVIIFAATLGAQFDRLLLRYSKVSPAKAVIFEAIGTAEIERVCDEFCCEVNCFTKPRFSPGYGDLPLEFQKEIFKVLDCPRKIGLTLNESLLMSPSKSVTAIVGITDKKCDDKSSCEACEKTNCSFRREQ